MMIIVLVLLGKVGLAQVGAGSSQVYKVLVVANVIVVSIDLIFGFCRLLVS
jgi:hypothetical protein